MKSEDWVASTTCCAGCEESKLGMSKLPDGRLLADAVAADPETWLGSDHIQRHGVDTKLLLKLLDAGQRLPVHAHPHRDWAKKHLGARHGKAEAWYILTPGEVRIGLREDVSEQELLDAANTQNIDPILSRMHRFDVKPHQVVYVPPGTLHSIGKGVLVVELQEPEDLSILVEWKGFNVGGPEGAHLGLGYPTALTAVNRTVWSDEEAAKLITSVESGSTVAKESEEYFILERVRVSGSQKCAPGFAIMVVLEGDIALKTASDERLDLKKGKTVVIPHSDGEFVLEGSSGDVLVARPPK
jgi:mannose-6-phosphate isomerase